MDAPKSLKSRGPAHSRSSFPRDGSSQPYSPGEMPFSRAVWRKGQLAELESRHSNCCPPADSGVT